MQKKAVHSAETGRNISDPTSTPGWGRASPRPETLWLVPSTGSRAEYTGALTMNIDLNLEHLPLLPRKRDFRIGVIGAGFIMRDVRLVAYKNAGFNVVAIASRDPANARATAELRAIPKVHNTWQELLADDGIEVLDIAVPPAAQPPIVHAALRHKHIRGILAQKPLATNYRDAQEIVRACEGAGVRLCVNQNMRYDHSIRALKTVLRRGYLGEPVLGTIEMRAIPHWKPWSRDSNKVTLILMSIHHLDSLRYLFGDPGVCVRELAPDHGRSSRIATALCFTFLEYANGLRAAAWDDVRAGPAREGGTADIYIKWRVEGTAGMAQGAIGWPGIPHAFPAPFASPPIKSRDAGLRRPGRRCGFPTPLKAPWENSFAAWKRSVSPC